MKKPRVWLALVAALCALQLLLLFTGGRRAQPQLASAEDAPAVTETAASPAPSAPRVATPSSERAVEQKPAAAQAPENLEKTLAASPGTHFDDDVRTSAVAQWEKERVDPLTAPGRENSVRDLFQQADVPDVLRNVECRETLCELILSPAARAHDQNGQKELAGKLGSSAAVVQSNDDEIVVLIPGGEIALQ